MDQPCANFVGFRCINELPFTRTLNRLSESYRPPGISSKILSFLRTLDGLLPDEPERSAIRAARGRYEPVRALSIRQPHAEAILRSVKKIEYRFGPTSRQPSRPIALTIPRPYCRPECKRWPSGKPTVPHLL